MTTDQTLRAAGRALLAGALLCTVALAVSRPAAADPYRVIEKIPIAGDGGWDYVAADSAARRLYVSHDTEIVVLDLDSGAIVGKIPGGEDTHGAAIARDFGLGFISASDPGSVTVFDSATLAVARKIRVGNDPNGIIYDPASKRIFTADRGSKRLTAIDPGTLRIVATSDNLGGRTEHLASDRAGHVFLNMQDRNTVLKFDAQSLKLLETWSTEPCGGPSSMDMDTRQQRIFIGCRNGMLIAVDANNGHIVAKEPIGMGVDALEYDPETGLIYASTGGDDGALSIFHQETPDAYTLLDTVKTQSGARTMAVDRKTGKVYLAVADFGPRPAATPDNPRPRPPVLPGTFTVLVVGK